MRLRQQPVTALQQLLEWSLSSIATLHCHSDSLSAVNAVHPRLRSVSTCLALRRASRCVLPGRRGDQRQDLILVTTGTSAHPASPRGGGARGRGAPRRAHARGPALSCHTAVDLGPVRSHTVPLAPHTAPRSCHVLVSQPRDLPRESPLSLALPFPRHGPPLPPAAPACRLLSPSGIVKIMPLNDAENEKDSWVPDDKCNQGDTHDTHGRVRQA